MPRRHRRRSGSLARTIILGILACAVVAVLVYVAMFGLALAVWWGEPPPQP